MCIICYKEKGVSAKLDWKVLETCFKNNPDGAGYAIARNGELILRKGFMAWNDFKTSLEKVTAGKSIKDSAILLHFRITTHGGTYPENTHPFPIGGESLTKRKYKSLEAVCAMNGICLSNETRYSYTWKKQEAPTNSDTMDAVENIITPLYQIAGNWWKKEQAKTVIDWLGAKWVFMEKNGDITAFGEFNKAGGWNYSNYSWKAPKQQKYNYDSYYGSNWKEWGISGNSLYYDMWEDLIPFTGKLLKSNGQILEVKKIDDYYQDDDGNIWLYDWKDDDYYLMENLTVLEYDDGKRELEDA